MLGIEILEVAMGIVFVYALVSIICSAIREGIEAWVKTRSVFLLKGIRLLLHDKDGTGLAKELYDHPLVNGLFASTYDAEAAKGAVGKFVKGSNLPSYIPTRNFALALMDLAARGPVSSETAAVTRPLSVDAIRQNVSEFANPEVRRVVITALDGAGGNLDQVRTNLEAWYDSSMDRVSGWYKRRTQWALFGIGLVVAIGLNIDTVTIAKRLYSDDGLRAATLAKIERGTADSNLPNANSDTALNQLAALELPIGWDPPAKSFDSSHAPGIFLGWLLTALAATMGAPFWFDLLNKMMVIRSTVKPHEKSPEEASDDRQPAPNPAPPAANAGPGTTNAPAIAPGGGALPPQPLPSLSLVVPSGENDRDGCDITIDESDITADEALPAAEGGVA